MKKFCAISARIIDSMIYIILVFIALFLFDDYLFTNIMTIGDNLARWTLLFVLFLLIGLLIWQVITSKKIHIRKSFIALIFFFSYFVFKIYIDTGNLNKLEAYTIGSSGGCFLFYSIAMLMSISFYKAKALTATSNRCFILFLLLSGIYLISGAYFRYKAYSELFGYLRSDRFLISLTEDSYQRPGAFLTISSLLLSFVYINILLNTCKSNFLCKILLFIYACILITILLFSMLLAQMIGSNNAFICNGCLLVINLVFYIFLLLPRVKFMLKKNIIRFKNIIYGRIFNKFIIGALIGLTVSIGILIFVINLLGIDIDQLRIIGYGSHDVSSVNSRLALLPNFIEQISYSPITPFVGNMQVDSLTTGNGTYVHSFLISIFTHLGIVGIILIMLFMFFALKELFDRSFGIYNNGMKIYKAILFFSFLLIATVATFFTWSVIWFLFGLFFLPVSLRNNNKSIFK